MPAILALDTSSDYCSASLFFNDTFYSVGELAPRKHAQLLLPMVTSLLKENGLRVSDLDALAFGRGPGSFTGLRIAAGVVQGLAYGASCSVIPVSNLKAMALQASIESEKPNVLVTIDARMDEVYWSECQVQKHDELWRVDALGGERVSKPELLELDEGEYSLIGVGSGLDYKDRFSSQVLDRISSFNAELRPHAESICRLAVSDYAQGISYAPEMAAPVYIRDEIAWKKLPGRE